MGRKVLKVFLWSVGVALASAVLGAKHSYAASWYLALLDKPAFLLTGGALGFLIGIATIKSERHPKMTEKSNVRYINREELVEGIKKQFSPEYAEFLLIQGGYSPKVCPKCGGTSFTTLWLAKPNNAIDGQMWAKWYFWCDKCLSGICCPLGTWRIPRTTPYILHGDEKALASALPENMKLIPMKLLPQQSGG